MNDSLVKILDGNTFVVSDARGDIEASFTDPTGLFSFDTRFLSRWVLTVNGERLNPLSVDDLQYFETRFFLVPGMGTVYIDAKLSVIQATGRLVGLPRGADDPEPRRRAVSLTTVRVDAGCDFADLFEVKDALRKKGRYSAKVERRKLTLGYERGPFVRATAITASEQASFDADGLTFTVKVPAHGEWSTDIDVVTERVGAGQAPLRAADPKRVQARMRRNLERWIGDAPCRGATGTRLKATYRQSLVDLAALRFSPPIAGGRALPAAGLPWFMTMFGATASSRACRRCPSRRSSARRRSARWATGRACGSTTSGTRIPAGSSTRCATGR